MPTSQLPKPGSVFLLPQESRSVSRGATIIVRTIDFALNCWHQGYLLGDWGLSSIDEFKDGVLTFHCQTDLDDNMESEVECPFPVGYPLAVREWWRQVDGIVELASDDMLEFVPSGGRLNRHYSGGPRWRSPKTMPESAVRLSVMFCDVKIKRLCEVTRDECKLSLSHWPRSDMQPSCNLWVWVAQLGACTVPMEF